MRAAFAPLQSEEKTPSSSTIVESATIVEPPDWDEATDFTSDEERQERARARLRSGLQRMIREFREIREGASYLEEVPPAYLAELFFILLSYLAIVWKDHFIEDDFFSESATALLSGFWGELTEPGAWTLIRNNLIEEDQQALLRKWDLCQRTWFIAFLLARLWKEDRTKIDDLAAWLRYFCSLDGQPDILREFSADEWEKQWQSSVPGAWERLSAEKVIAELNAILPRYNEKTLIAELKAWPNTRVEKKFVNISNISRVPALEIHLPFTSQEDGERCLDAFLTFLRWPHQKNAAWMICYNVNPASHPEAIASLRFLYRDDLREFFVAKKASDFDDPYIIYELSPTTPTELIELRANGELRLPPLFSTT